MLPSDKDRLANENKTGHHVAHQGNQKQPKPKVCALRMPRLSSFIKYWPRALLLRLENLHFENNMAAYE